MLEGNTLSRTGVEFDVEEVGVNTLPLHAFRGTFVRMPKAERKPPLPPPARLRVFPPSLRLPVDGFSENGVSGRCDRRRWGEG